jgi:hypothetical protein
MSPQVLVDRTLCCSLFFSFFLRCFFHINNFLCITVWHIYNKYNQTVVCIHAGFLTWYNLYHVRNTYIMSETRHGYKLLFDCIYCIYVIQWYIESCKMLFIWKKVDVKKIKIKKKKSEQHRVLSTSTCGDEHTCSAYQSENTCSLQAFIIHVTWQHFRSIYRLNIIIKILPDIRIFLWILKTLFILDQIFLWPWAWRYGCRFRKEVRRHSKLSRNTLQIKAG